MDQQHGYPLLISQTLVLNNPITNMKAVTHSNHVKSKSDPQSLWFHLTHILIDDSFLRTWR